MFWDKLEKSNYFLEAILNTADENWNSRLIMHLLSPPYKTVVNGICGLTLLKNTGLYLNLKCMNHTHPASHAYE